MSEPGNGVRYASDAVTIIATDEMAWEPFAGRLGAHVKTLTRFADGEPELYLLWFPPGPLRAIRHGKNYRHYHKSVREYMYFLSGGPFPHWDYDSAEQVDGHLINFRADYYMDRRPGSMHGVEIGPFSHVGMLGLNWRSGTGNYVDEPNFHDESIEIDYPPGPGVAGGPWAAPGDEAGTVYRRDDVVIRDVRMMDWEPLESVPGAQLKALSRFASGEPEVMIVSFPAASVAYGAPHRHHHRSVREWMFVLDGELVQTEYPDGPGRPGRTIALRRGGFVERLPGPGGWHGAEGEPLATTDATVLIWRTGPGTLPGEAGYDTEMVSA